MNCRETQQMISQYLNNTLDQKELQAFLAHVKECPSCYEELEIYYTIHCTLDYLDGEEIGYSNSAVRLIEELEYKRQKLRKSCIFHGIQAFIVGLAIVSTIITGLLHYHLRQEEKKQIEEQIDQIEETENIIWTVK